MNFILSIFDKLKKRLLANWISYIGKYGQSVKDGYKSNAFSPLVWFIVIFVTPLFVTIWLTNDLVFKYSCFGLIVLVLIFAFCMYIKLLNKDPKLLQSEWYRLEDKKLDMVAQQGEGDEAPIVITEKTTSTEIKSTPILGE
ncbi:MAG: hypothetical protein WDM90_02280 [Ferruginibacter sp.]